MSRNCIRERETKRKKNSVPVKLDLRPYKQTNIIDDSINIIKIFNESI